MFAAFAAARRRMRAMRSRSVYRSFRSFSVSRSRGSLGKSAAAERDSRSLMLISLPIRHGSGLPSIADAPYVQDATSYRDAGRQVGLEPRDVYESARIQLSKVEGISGL